MARIEVRLLGEFEVRLDGEPVTDAAWSRGRAKDLVKLLALAPGHRLVRERVVEALWPQLDAEAGVANLHKAAHHARGALGGGGSLVLREGEVLLAPEAEVATDVERFEASGDPGLYCCELLPGDRYAAWTQERREELRDRYLEVLRAAGRWEELAAAEPADEHAQRAVMRVRLVAGDRLGALAAYESLREALVAQGLEPSLGAVAFHARLAGGAALDGALAKIEAELEQAPVAERADLLATRADLLMAIGDRGAPARFREGSPSYLRRVNSIHERRRQMKTYVIFRREGWSDPEALEAAAKRSRQVGDEEMPEEVRWIRSYVLAENGRVGTVCIYQAVSPEALRKHASRADIPADEIIEVVDTVYVRPDPEPISA